MNRGRWWLALAYTFATLVAQGVHDHDPGAEDAAPESHGDCDESRPHAAAHHVISHGEAPTSCPSCQFRAQHPLAELAPRPLPGPSLAAPTDLDRSSPLPGSPLRDRCRAPPTA